jgi:hypothetical protein
VGADDKKDAAYAVESRLADWMGREFYYDGYLVRDDNVTLLTELAKTDRLLGYTRTQSKIQLLREEAVREQRLQNALGEARALRRASDLLFENMCIDMPWYNIDYGDFTVPSEPPKSGKWWAVMVDFYY